MTDLVAQGKAEGRDLIRQAREAARRDPALADSPEFIRAWEKVVAEVMALPPF